MLLPSNSISILQEIKLKVTSLNLNIRSLNQNFDKLNQLLKCLDHKFTIIGLTETQLTDKPDDGHLHLPDYDLKI